MWEEDIMRKTIWDIPNYHGCNKWSDDGMLAVLTANSIQVFTPTFKHNSFYLARWMQLELMGENDGVPKKSKVYVAPKESFTASTAEDLIKWMSTVNSTDDRSFGKLDINSMYFKKMLWSPPGLGIFSSSILSALLSNGSVLLVVMVGSSHMNHKIFTNDRRFNVHMFSMSIALDLSSLFQEWLAQKGNGAGITDQTTKMDVDSDSDDDTEDEEHERGNGLKEFHGGACIINEIACYPHLLSYNGMQHGRTDCMIFATGSSLGHINLWAIQSTSGYLLEASCVCSVLLTESSLQSSSSSNSQYFQGNSQHHSHSVTCMEFLTTTDDCDRSYNGNFSTRLLCGTSEGFFVVFNINSASGNLLDGEMNSGDYVLRRGVGGLPLLKMGKPRHILRPFDSPVDSITVSSNACCNVYLRSGVKLVQTDSEFQHIFPVENIHSNVVTSISVIDSREYSTKGPSGVGILLTSSLDGDVKLWAELPCRAYQYVDYGINDISCNNDSHNRNENEGEDQDNVTTTIPLDKEMKQNRDENCNLNFIELFNVNDKMNNNNLSYVDITSDPLQLIYAITHLIPSSIIDSREVQMNKNLERSHCGLYIFLSPILDLKWITIPGNVLQVFKSIIFSSSTSLLSSKNFDKNVMNDDPQVNSSYSNNYSGENSDNHNCHNIDLTGHSQNNERRYDFTSYYHNYSEEYFDVKAISGLSFSWLKSLEEVVQHYVATSMNTAVGNLTINEKVELGIVDTNKRYREKCKDEDEENEEDGIASKTGISDVAHKVKNLLYPNIENLLSDSFEVAIVAADSIAVDLNGAMQRDRNHDTGDDSIDNSYRNDSSSGRAGREEREGEGGVYIKESNSVLMFEGCESSFSTLLSLPIQDDRVLYYKLKLWRSLHQVLLAVSQSRGIPLGARYLILAKSLRKNIQIGMAVCTARRILREHKLWEDKSGNTGSSGSTFLTSQEIISLSFVRELLRDCLGELSDALHGLIACWHSKHKHRTFVTDDSGTDIYNGDTIAKDNTSALNSCLKTPSETCSICGTPIEFKCKSSDDAVRTATCTVCRTEFDRCSITLLTIGFDPIIEGHVLKCSVCQAVGLLHSKTRIKHSNGKIQDPNGISVKEFNLGWWIGKAPCCPYCGILMVPLT